MTSINIQTRASYTTIGAIETLILSIDPTAVITYDNEIEQSNLNEADEIRLQEIYDKTQNNAMNYHTHDEVIKSTHAYLKKLGATV